MRLQYAKVEDIPLIKDYNIYEKKTMKFCRLKLMGQYN